MTKETTLPNRKTQASFGYQKYSTVLLGLIMLIGILLRLFNLGTESYWIDEMSTVIEGQQNIQQLLTSGRLDQPPAYYIPFHFWEQIFGTTEISTRAFSALVGIALILVIYFVGCQLFGKGIALLSAFLMAISEFQIYYSQVARFYGFFELMALLSFLFFILALRNKQVVYYFLYVIASLIMLYSHTYGVFILAGQNFYFFVRLKKYSGMLLAWLICQALVILAYAPYVYSLLYSEGSVLDTIQSNVGDLTVPSLRDLLRSLYHYILPARRTRSWEGVLVNYAMALAWFAAGIGIYAYHKGVNKIVSLVKGSVTSLRQTPDLKDNLLMVVFWLLCPILLPYVLSYLAVSPLYKDYYTISAAPAFYLLLAWGIFSIRKAIPLLVTVGALTIVIVPGLIHYYVTDIHEQWREVAATITENSEPNDSIVVAPNMGIGIQEKTFDWYYQGNLVCCALDTTLADPDEISDAMSPCSMGHDRMWVIIPNYTTVTYDDRYKSFFLSQEHTTMHMKKEYQFFNISVYLFELEE